MAKEHLAAKVVRLPELRSAAAEVDEVLPEAPQAVLVFVRGRPVKVVPLGVVAVRVVVAVLRVAVLVALQDHRHALREQQRDCEVADLPLPQRVDAAVVRRALLAAVPRQVVRLSCTPKYP